MKRLSLEDLELEYRNFAANHESGCRCVGCCSYRYEIRNYSRLPEPEYTPKIQRNPETLRRSTSGGQIRDQLDRFTYMRTSSGVLNLRNTSRI